MDARNRLEQIAQLIKSQSTLVLATTSDGGRPCSTPLFYIAGDDLRLYWFSSSASAHSKNLKRNPAAAASIYRPKVNWKEIRGLQMEGTVATVKDRALRKAISAAYGERFHLGAIFRTAIAHSSLYVFRPEWVRYIDNSKRFGSKFELTLADGDLGVTEK